MYDRPQRGRVHDYDAIVIGSGAGGMSAALALARAGERVLVLEQHYVPGGWCHSFTLGGHRFSPGVHYVGELEPGGRLRRLYEGLGVAGDLTFFELNPDGYDHVLAAGQRFDIPKGREKLRERLAERFPAEATAVRRYLDTVDRLKEQLGHFLRLSNPLDLLALPFRAPTVLRHGQKPLADLFRHTGVRDPFLRAVLGIQCGDHGLPPARAPAAVHAAVAGHYLDGGYYPQGGGFTIPRAFLRALKRAGGELRLRAPVAKILVEGRGWHRRTVGVALADGTELRSRRVISNADPHMTFQHLVGPEHLSRRLVRRLGRTVYSVSAVSLYLGVDMDLAAAGFDSGNYWFTRSVDLEEMYAQGTSGCEPEEIPALFLTMTTLKDPSKGDGRQHTLEAFALLSYDLFAPWADSQSGARPPEYEALKQRLTEKMLRAVEQVVPGIRAHITFSELGTPLTNQHYVAGTRGALYGTEKSRSQVGFHAFRSKTEIQGLYLCGASTLSHGVIGATMSGVAAARTALGCRTRDLLLEDGPQLTILSPEDPHSWPDSLRRSWEQRRARAALKA